MCEGYFSLNDDIFSREFKKAIEDDYMRMNNQYLGAKTEASKKDFKKWMVDGRFLPLMYLA